MTKQLKMSVIYIYIYISSVVQDSNYGMLLGEKYKNSLYFITAKDSTVKKCPNHLANPVNSLLWTGKKKS